MDTYCPVDIVQFGKLDQFLSKVQMVHIMLYFPTRLEHSDQGTIWLDPNCTYKDDIVFSKFLSIFCRFVLAFYFKDF